MKKVIVSVLCISVLFSFSGCMTTTVQTNDVQYEQVTDMEEKPTEEVVDIKYDPMSVGSTVTSDDWKIKLTDAYTSDTLESSESRTAWEASDGYAFLVLEFDVTCLNSTKPTIDGEAITELVATAGGNTYEDWEYQYISSELWLYIRNTYLEANLPLHIYVYAMIPSASANSNVSVNLKIAGQPKVITI